MSYTRMADIGGEQETHEEAPVEARSRFYSEEEISQGLEALVVCAGSATHAARFLAEHGATISRDALQRWKRRDYVERYERLREEYAPRLEEAMVLQARETATYAAEVEWKAIEAAERRLDDNLERDPARVAGVMSAIKTRAVDQLMTMTGRPKDVIEVRRAPEEILRSLAAKGLFDIDLDPADVQELPESTQGAPMTPSQDAA